MRDNQPLPLESLRVFVAVIDHGGFQRAAAALGRPKSTVSRAVQQLEAEAGLRLLQRTTRRMALTAAGRALYEQAAPALRALREAHGALASLRQEPGGLLRVTAPPTFGALFLPELAAEFLRRHRDVRLAVDLSEPHRDLIAEGFDVALRAGELPDSSLVRRELGATRLGCFASPGYLAQHGTPVEPRDLAAHECVLHGSGDGGAGMTWLFRGPRGRSLPVEVRGRLCVDNYLAVRDAAVAGLGVAQVFSFLAAAQVAAGRLVPLLVAYEPPPMRLAAVYPSARHVGATLRAFLDFLEERVAAAPW